MLGYCVLILHSYVFSAVFSGMCSRYAYFLSPQLGIGLQLSLDTVKLHFIDPIFLEHPGGERTLLPFGALQEPCDESFIFGLLRIVSLQHTRT